MNLAHPILAEMFSLGCSDNKKVLMGFQTYLELCERCNLKDVQYHYSPQLDHIYLSAVDEGEPQYFLPLVYTDLISPLWIKKAISSICDKTNQDLYLVLRDMDTSVVIYKVTSGLVEPLHPDVTKELKATEEKKALIQAEIKRMIPSLIQECVKNSD